jgi:anhydro-N-acetylmuramic acid kinase
MSCYAGLMSGTSLDGIDAVLVDITTDRCQVLAATHEDYPDALLARLRRAIEAPAQVGLDELGALDTQVGEAFAAAALSLLRSSGLDAAQVRAIGSHGQTLRHQPRGSAPFSLQIGDANVIAERTGIDVVADFRRRDVAAGGEGAPLVPAFHAALFAKPGQTRVVANIGGIANITVLHADGAVTGFDTGPGNCLMDGWLQRYYQQDFDRDGALAAAGHVYEPLLSRLLTEPYFALPAPKSTGRELFNLAWLQERLGDVQLSPQDMLATLCQYTAETLARAIAHSGTGAVAELLICGGGALNPQLMQRLGRLLPATPVCSTAQYGIATLHVEAAAFAWMAHQHLQGLPANLPAVTGARGLRCLGALYPGAVTAT